MTNPESSLYEEMGYKNLCSKGSAGLCGTRDFLFTSAVVVGLTQVDYRGRYCFETGAEATAALSAWDGTGDPAGAWIKYKGSDGERLGPGCLTKQA